MTDAVRHVIREALGRISERRFFQSERGYQGALSSELKQLLGQNARIWPGNPIFEEEYQRRLRDHGLRIRPDLILHVPFERGTVSDRREGNFVVIELKRRASPQQAFNEFDKLIRICRVLNYPMGVFINIDTDQHYLSRYQGDGADLILAFAVKLIHDTPMIRE